MKHPNIKYLKLHVLQRVAMDTALTSVCLCRGRSQKSLKNLFRMCQPPIFPHRTIWSVVVVACLNLRDRTGPAVIFKRPVTLTLKLRAYFNTCVLNTECVSGNK